MSHPTVFISYKRGHQVSEEFIHKIEKELIEEFELLRDANMEVGKRWTRELYDWLLGCDAAIIIVSDEANHSDWCRREWAVLVACWEIKGIPVIPVCVESSFFDTGILDEIQGTKGLISTDDVIVKIKATLSNVSSRPFTAEDFLAAHRAWLSWQYEEAPVFQKEPYALSDVYIEPECGSLLWEQVEKDRIDPFQEKEESGGRQPMLDTVLELIADPAFSDLIAIQAGPGAGKSAFALRLASTLINEDLQPILVKFGDLRLSSFSNVGELLDDAIRIGYSDEESPNPDSEIISGLLEERMKFRQADICKTVIILDGWDEVSLTGNESFKAQLSTWLPKIRDYFIHKRGAKVRMILTGRPSGEVSHSGVLRKATPLLTMRPMRPEQFLQYAEKISQLLIEAQKNSVKETQETVWALDLDTLKPVFEHYQNWFNGKRTQSSDSTGDFLGNPLLAYLSFRVFAETDKSPENLISKPTALYHELINITVKHSGKGLDEGLEDSVHRGGEELRRLLQEVAATISILRSESVSFSELKARFDDRELPIPEQLLKDWYQQADTETALQELVINFYFKGGYTNLGCEFLHKSFREYLYAEAIFYALLDSAKNQEGLFKSVKVYEYWEDFELNSAEYRLSRRLSYLLAPQWLTNEVRTHLFWLIENDIESDPDRWRFLRDFILSIYAWWAEGALLRHQPTRSRARSRWEEPFVDSLFQQVIPFDVNEDLAPIRSSVLDSHLGHALMQITAFIFHLLFNEYDSGNEIDGRDLSYCSVSDGLIRFNPGGEGFLRSLVSKFDTEGWRKQPGLSDMFLSGITLVNEECAFLVASDCNFSEADLSEAYLSTANLSNADLWRADLWGANLSSADLSSADLSRAYLCSADLISANLSSADLSRADLSSADLSSADLSRADLSSADLSGINLSGANLSGANLSSADLSSSDLSWADLSGADLSKADLSGADLKGVKGYNPK